MKKILACCLIVLSVLIVRQFHASPSKVAGKKAPGDIFVCEPQEVETGTNPGGGQG